MSEEENRLLKYVRIDVCNKLMNYKELSNDDIYAIDMVTDLVMKKQKEIELNYKVIEEMLNDLYEAFQERPGNMFKVFGQRFCKYEDCTDIEVTCKECIKEYYENKAKGE